MNKRHVATDVGFFSVSKQEVSHKTEIKWTLGFRKRKLNFIYPNM